MARLWRWIGATRQIIGSSRYHGYDAERSVIEIGWTFLARSHWGGRYNGEMKRLMLEHTFKSVQRVIFIIAQTIAVPSEPWRKLEAYELARRLMRMDANAWYMSSRRRSMREGQDPVPPNQHLKLAARDDRSIRE